MRRVLSVATYPGVLLGSLGTAAWLLTHTGWPVPAVVAAVLAVDLVCLHGLEAVIPAQGSWRPSSAVRRLDMLHTAVSAGLSQLVKVGGLAGMAAVLHPRVDLGVWPTAWPVVAQLVLAVLVADLSLWAAHRWMHETELGWRIHVVHHSIDQMHVWASARTHPLNVGVKVAAESGLLLLLGIGTEVYGLWLLTMTLNGLLQHANLELSTRWMSGVWATEAVHRVHHARDPAIGHSNYGSTTVLWDRLFGTWRRPETAPDALGAGGYAIPSRYTTHLVAPFVLRRFEADDPPG